MTRTRRHGFTLVEASLCMVIVALMMAAGFGVTGAAARTRQVMGEQRLADTLLQAMHAEIATRLYREPRVGTLGVDSGEKQADRFTLDDADDYNGLRETPPMEMDGRVIDGTKGWERSVRVEFVGYDPATLTVRSTGADEGLKRITVTVRAPNGKSFTRIVLRAERGTNDSQKSATGALEMARVMVRPTGGVTSATHAPLLNRPLP